MEGIEEWKGLLVTGKFEGCHASSSFLFGASLA